MKKSDTNNVLPFSPASSGADTHRRKSESVLVLRHLNPEADQVQGQGLVAFDRRDAGTDLEACQKRTQDYLSQNFNELAYAPNLYGVGLEMRNRFDLGRSNHWAAEMLGLKRADDQVTQALVAALLGTAATSISPLFLETALFGIGSFVHALPRFARIRGAVYDPPFGAFTEYTVCQVQA